MILEAVLLGLSTGTYCSMYCGPVLIPFLCGTEKVSCKRNAGLTGAFLGARLVMYFILGAVFGAMGLLVQEFFDPSFARRLSVFAYLFCGLVLLFNSLGVRFPWTKECGCKVPSLKMIGNDFMTAILAGLAVGMHICPPLWTAIVRSVFGGNGIPFFIPLLGIPFVAKRSAAIRQVARISQFLIALYFIIFNGLIPFLFG